MLRSRSDLFHKFWSGATNSLVCKQCMAWLFLLFLLLAVGCAPNADNPLVDHSFLTGEPCAPPCWYRLELDKSSEEEVYATLEELAFIDQDSIRETDFAWLGDPNAKEIFYGCLHPKDESCGGARFANGKLKLLWMAVGYDLTFAIAVERLGSPEYVDYGPYHPEVGGCVIDLNWPEKGITLHSLDMNSDQQCRAIKDGGGIDSGIRVKTIYYGAKEVSGPKPGGCCTRIPWPGFVEP